MYITEHAAERLQQRMGFLPDAEYIEHVFMNGKRLDELPPKTKFNVRRNVFFTRQNQNPSLRIHDGFIFIFDSSRLVTAFAMPPFIQKLHRMGA